MLEPVLVLLLSRFMSLLLEVATITDKSEVFQKIPKLFIITRKNLSTADH